MGAFELLAGLTSRVAVATELSDVVDPLVHEIFALGFGLVWLCSLDEAGQLVTLRARREGLDDRGAFPSAMAIDARQPLGRSIRDRRIFNVSDPSALHLFDRDDDVVPSSTLGLTKAVAEQLRGHPFACVPLVGAAGVPVGAVCLGSFYGNQPIPDELLLQGLLRAFLDLLALGIDRASGAARAARLAAGLERAHETHIADAPIKAVGTLAASTAHDLNHLSGIVRIALDVAVRSPDDAAAALPRIDRANRVIGDLVARLWRVSRPRAAEPAAAPELADVGQVVGDLAVMVTPMLRERAIELTTELPALPRVRCDATLLLQVVLNLVVNARDAMESTPDDRRQIQIVAREHAGTVYLHVADTGPGIAPDVLSRLFTQVFTTKTTGHMGLGLNASQSALAPFGAKLSARNALSGGAVFQLALVAAPAEAVATPSASPPTPTPTRGSRAARILVVDDDPDVVDIILAYLEPLGYQVASATTSAHALELAAKQRFDLILCDVGMPKQSGLEISRALRAAGYPGKIVLMTGWETSNLSSDARDTASDMLLKKPFVGGDLIAMIETMLVC